MLQENFIRDDESEEPNAEIIFNVKSIKVSWDNIDESFMHVFINTTQVKKLELERANRRYQHMMFASLSHELRTPLNAFANSLYLIKFTFDCSVLSCTPLPRPLSRMGYRIKIF